MTTGNGAVLRVVGPAQLNAAIKTADAEAAAAKDAASAITGDVSTLASHVRTQFAMMRNHRDNATSGWSERLLAALRAFNGTYDAGKLMEISQFGGSNVYARVTAMKCRGAASLLRDVYLSHERPWGIEPPDDPTVPDEIMQAISTLVQSELQGLGQSGAPIDLNAVRDRTQQLTEAARQAAKKKAAGQATIAEDKLDEILKEGGFYRALAEFITDLPMFPFACIKGPVVRIVPQVKWVNGKAVQTNKPRLFWERVSPFDIWWTPGVSDIEDASVIERSRVTRTDLNDLLDLPGYNVEAIRAVLDEYGRGGLSDNWDTTDAERADAESRENPHFNRSGLISCLLFSGNCQGRMLLESGALKSKQIPDPMRDYSVQIWMIGNHVIKAQINPSPRKRHAYFITSFEKVPGTPVGNALPDILSDVQDVANATMRSLVNNLSIASGPQVVVNDDRLAPGENGEDLYPWKRWHVTSDPMMNNSAQKPIDFFQPSSNAQELLGVYQAFVTMADELSAIPKYMTGSGAPGGAGRTASGLAMLMGNASKLLQTVAANIDRDVMDPLLGGLYDMVMLTDKSGLLTGEEKVRVMGVAVAVQKETQRARQLEFLQITANPVDLGIIGPRGRANILRSVSETIGLDGQVIVPSDSDLDAQQKQAAASAASQGAPGHAVPGQPAPPPGDPRASQGPQGGAVNGNTGPVTNIAGGAQ